jgi:RHS repeat-associated protein
MSDFGLLFCTARWYDPTIAHFVQADSIVPGGVQGYDRYAYVSNRPTSLVDPSGHYECEVGEPCGRGATFVRETTNDEFTQNLRDRIKDKFGITMADDVKKWDAANLMIVYSGLSTMNSTLGGQMKALVGSASFLWADNATPGHYSGYTNDRTITFYTNSTIPNQNLYHEFGHLLDNTVGRDVFSNAVAQQATYSADGAYLFGGSGVGTISITALRSAQVSDPNWGDVDALQHPSTDPVEQWADMWANYVSDNMNGQPDGLALQQAVQNYFVTGLANR